MTTTEIFDIAALLRFFAPSVICLVVFLAARGLSRSWARALLAIAAGWLFDILFSVYVFKPAGIAYARETGMASPETLFGSNIGTTALASGWLFPTLIVLFLLACRKVWRLLRKPVPEAGQETQS